MLKLHIPPQNAPDDLVEWISPSDDAWDSDRTSTENEILTEAALAALPEGSSEAERESAADAARNTHPISRWYSGETRHSHLAVIPVPQSLRTDDHPDSTVTIGEYLTGVPTIFVIKSIGARNYRAALGAGKLYWQLELVRFGLVKLTGVEKDGDEHLPERRPDGSITESWLDRFDCQDRSLMRDLGTAIHTVCQKAGSEEKP